MKKIILFSLIVFCAVFSIQAQDRQAILKVMESSRQAWNKGDLDTFMQCYWKSDSVMFVAATGPTFGYENTLQAYKKTYGTKKAELGNLTYAIKKVELLNTNNAFVYGGWTLKHAKDSQSGYYTLWFKKVKGLWKIVVDHSS